MRQITDNLRVLAVSLDGRELRLRGGETVSPLGESFAAGADEDSNGVGLDFEDDHDNDDAEESDYAGDDDDDDAA